jgi:hypothetical protein
MNKLKLQNLSLVIIDNNCYASTGCQPTCSDAVDFTKMANCKVFKTDPIKSDFGRIEIPHKELTKRFYNAVNGM